MKLDEIEFGPQDAKAGTKPYDRGYNAFQHGVPVKENPYSPESEDHAKWLKGWRKAQQDNT